MRKLIALIALVPATAMAEPAFKDDEIKSIEILFDAACRGAKEPGLNCARMAIDLVEKAKAAEKKPAEPKP